MNLLWQLPLTIGSIKYESQFNLLLWILIVIKRSLQYASQSQSTMSSHIQAQSAPYPSFSRFQRPMLAAFPLSAHQGPDRSPSPSEESQAGHAEPEVCDIEAPPRLYPAQDQYPKQQSNEDTSHRQ